MNNLNPVQKKFITYISILAIVMIVLVIGYIFIQPSASDNETDNDIDVSDSTIDENETSLSTRLRLSGATSFLSLLESLDLVNDLDQNSARITVIAPNNSALESLNSENMSNNQLEEIIRNHIISTEIFTNVAVNGASFTTLGGENVVFEILNGELIITKGETTAITITPNLIFDNGVIHVIDRLLTD